MTALRSPCIACSSTEDRKLCSQNCEAREKFAEAVQASTPLLDVTVGISGRVKKRKGVDMAETIPETKEQDKNIVTTVKEVAEHFGIANSKVSTWKYRKNPMPVREDGSYDLDAIKTWRDNEKFRPMPRKKNKEGDGVKEDQKEKPVVLDLKSYPEIEKRLSEMSEETLLPVPHIVMSLVGEGLARKMDQV